MEKNLYIDASHPDETRVVLKENGNIEDYEYEGIKNTLIKNNIYLGKVSRIEASLQAAFVDIGSEKNGFLAFGEIHPNYFQIPVADREALIQAEAELEEEHNSEDIDDTKDVQNDTDSIGSQITEINNKDDLDLSGNEENKDSEIEKTMSIVIKEMSEAHKPVVDLSVDLKVEAASGKNWDQAH